VVNTRRLCLVNTGRSCLVNIERSRLVNIERSRLVNIERSCLVNIERSMTRLNQPLPRPAGFPSSPLGCGRPLRDVSERICCANCKPLVCKPLSSSRLRLEESPLAPLGKGGDLRGGQGRPKIGHLIRWMELNIPTSNPRLPTAGRPNRTVRTTDRRRRRVHWGQ
jgi:hypothetical protein